MPNVHLALRGGRPRTQTNGLARLGNSGSPRALELRIFFVVPTDDEEEPVRYVEILRSLLDVNLQNVHRRRKEAV